MAADNMDQVLGEIKSLVADHKVYVEKSKEQWTNVGAEFPEVKASIDKILGDIKEHQRQLDAQDKKLSESRFAGFVGNDGASASSLADNLFEHELFKKQNPGDQELIKKGANWTDINYAGGRLRVPVGDPFARRKALITTSAGLTGSTTGVFVPQRLAPVELARQDLRIRDLMNVINMGQGNSFDFMKQTVRTNAPSPQVEGQAKAESTYSWDATQGSVKTLAHFVNVTRQALDDLPELRGMIDSELMYGLLLKEEQEILNGDGSGQHLNGLTHVATPYAGTYDEPDDQALDTLRHAKLEARLAGLATYQPDGIVLNPVDMHWIELIKTEEGGDNKGVYVLGDPRGGPSVPLVWGLPVVVSDSIAAGHFLIGSFRLGATLVDRMSAIIQISYEHANNFTENKATILCEERIGLAIKVATSFIYGALPSH